MRAAKLDTLMAEYALLQAQANLVQPIFDRMEEIEDEFRTLRTGTYQTESGALQVSPNTRFDSNLAAEMLSERSLARVTVPTISSALVKRHFPGVYRRARNEFANRVHVEVSQTAVKRNSQAARKAVRAALRAA